MESELICRGSYALGTACGHCRRCSEEVRRLKAQPVEVPTPDFLLKLDTGETLKPCPFCGERAELRRKVDHPEWIRAVCISCDEGTNFYRASEYAARQWNRRAPAPATDGEALEQIYAEGYRYLPGKHVVKFSDHMVDGTGHAAGLRAVRDAVAAEKDAENARLRAELETQKAATAYAHEQRLQAASDGQQHYQELREARAELDALRQAVGALADEVAKAGVGCRACEHEQGFCDCREWAEKLRALVGKGGE